jgi:molybdenum cofactor synthesis domain-containing protein
MKAAIVTVGDELLAGDTENTNATWLCARLDDRGVDVERVTTLPDRVSDIARVVNEYHAEYDAVVVTGGLGPTHDDVTMEGVATAFGRDVGPHEAALAWLKEEGGYAADELAEGTTDLPEGSRPLHNTEGVAPGAVVQSCYVLPGVPAEMKAMFAAVADEFEGAQTYSETVETRERTTRQACGGTGPVLRHRRLLPRRNGDPENNRHQPRGSQARRWVVGGPRRRDGVSPVPSSGSTGRSRASTRRAVPN